MASRVPRGAAQAAHAAGVPGQRAHAAVGCDALDARLAAVVAGGDECLAVGQPLAGAVAHRWLVFRRRAAHPPHGALPQRQREELAAHLGSQAVPLRMQLHALQMRGCRHEAARRLAAMPGHTDGHRLRHTAGGVEQPHGAGALVDDALAVAGRVAGVEAVVVGVARQRAAIGLHRVQVARALEIAEEVHPPAQPHRAGDVAVQLAHAAKVAAAVGVDPQMAGGATAVAFPARRVGGVAADHARAARPQRQMVDLAQRQALGRAAVGVDGEGVQVAEERLAVVAGKQDAAIGQPAAHMGVGAQPGEPTRRAAFGRHDKDLGMLLVAAGVGQPAAIGRQRRARRL